MRVYNEILPINDADFLSNLNLKFEADQSKYCLAQGATDKCATVATAEEGDHFCKITFTFDDDGL